MTHKTSVAFFFLYGAISSTEKFMTVNCSNAKSKLKTYASAPVVVMFVTAHLRSPRLNGYNV